MKYKSKMYILGLCFIIMIVFGIYKVYSIINEYKTGIDTYNDLERYVENNKNISDSDEIINFPVVDFKSLKNINNDVIAWIYGEGTEINYPIVQGEDNDYYLKHMIDGSYNSAGSIFLDYRNKSDFSNKHTIIYGHNMKNETMFTTLNKYDNQNFYDEHPFYLLVTPTKNYKIEFFSGYVASVNDNAWMLNFKDDQEFENWLKQTKDKSLFESSIIPTINDNIITLSTCSNEFNNARFVLIGILKEYK